MKKKKKVPLDPIAEMNRKGIQHAQRLADVTGEPWMYTHDGDVVQYDPRDVLDEARCFQLCKPRNGGLPVLYLGSPVTPASVWVKFWPGDKKREVKRPGYHALINGNHSVYVLGSLPLQPDRALEIDGQRWIVGAWYQPHGYGTAANPPKGLVTEEMKWLYEGKDPKKVQKLCPFGYCFILRPEEATPLSYTDVDAHIRPQPVPAALEELDYVIL